MDWTLCEDQLPPLGKYVLAHVPTRPWLDGDDDPHFVIVKRIPERPSYNPNNRGLDYSWDEFGPGNFFGHEVVRWCAIPLVLPPAQRENK